jgi:hypothetical protein
LPPELNAVIPSDLDNARGCPKSRGQPLSRKREM